LTVRLPEPTPIAAPFFDALREGRLLLPFCPADGFFFYPRNRCPVCLQGSWVWRAASGRGRVYSFTVDRIGHEPGLAASVPVVIAIVALDEGPRIAANIVGCAWSELSVGMTVEAVFTPCESGAILQFQPGASF
jgi:uncharacterized protein